MKSSTDTIRNPARRSVHAFPEQRIGVNSALSMMRIESACSRGSNPTVLNADKLFQASFEAFISHIKKCVSRGNYVSPTLFIFFGKFKVTGR